MTLKPCISSGKLELKRGEEKGAYRDLIDGWKDIRGDEAVGVDDECRAGYRSTRYQRRGLLGNGNSKDAAHGGQRQRGRDGGDHAGEGEHRWGVTKAKKKRKTTKLKVKPTSGL